MPSAENGKPAGDALGHADDVGLDAVVLDGEHLAGATEAALHLVGDEQDAVLPAALDEAGQERVRRGDVAALAEHRLEDHRRGLVGRGHRLQQVVEARRAPRSTSASWSAASGSGYGATNTPDGSGACPAR